jgi:hypothetical protein
VDEGSFPFEETAWRVGKPISVAADVRRPLPPEECVAFLNIWGMRPRDREEGAAPSGGCRAW